MIGCTSFHLLDIVALFKFMTFVCSLSYINLIIGGSVENLTSRGICPFNGAGKLHFKWGGRFFSLLFLCSLSFIKFIRFDILDSLSNGQESHCFHWRNQMSTRKKRRQSQLHIHIHFSTSSSLLLVCTQQCSWLDGPPLLAEAAD